MIEEYKTLADVEKLKQDRIKLYGVYKLKNKTNGDFYIGSSRDLHARLRDHYLEVLGNKSAYFIDCELSNIEIEILHFASSERETRESEEHFIRTMNPNLNKVFTPLHPVIPIYEPKTNRKIKRTKDKCDAKAFAILSQYFTQKKKRKSKLS